MPVSVTPVLFVTYTVAQAIASLPPACELELHLHDFSLQSVTNLQN